MITDTYLVSELNLRASSELAQNSCVIHAISRLTP